MKCSPLRLPARQALRTGFDKLRTNGEGDRHFRRDVMTPPAPASYFLFAGNTIIVQSLSGRRYFAASVCNSSGVV